MKDVFYAMPILFSCLCGCGGYERLLDMALNLDSKRKLRQTLPSGPMKYTRHIIYLLCVLIHV